MSRSLESRLKPSLRSRCSLSVLPAVCVRMADSLSMREALGRKRRTHNCRPALELAFPRAAVPRPQVRVEALRAVLRLEVDGRDVKRSTYVTEQALERSPERVARRTRAAQKTVRAVLRVDVNRNRRVRQLFRADAAAEERGEAVEDRFHVSVTQGGEVRSEPFRRVEVDEGRRLALEDKLSEAADAIAVTEEGAGDAVEEEDLVEVNAMQNVAGNDCLKSCPCLRILRDGTAPP